MTTESTRRTIDTLFEKLGSGASPKEVAALFSDSVDWSVPGATAVVPWLGPRSSPLEVADFYETLARATELLRFDVHKSVVVGDTGVVLGYFESKVLGTQRTIASEFAMHLRVSNGKIEKYRFYEDSYAVAQAVA